MYLMLLFVLVGDAIMPVEGAKANGPEELLSFPVIHVVIPATFELNKLLFRKK